MATTTPLVLAPELTDALRAKGKDIKVPQSEALNHLTTSGGKSFPGFSSRIQKTDVETNSKTFDPASLQAKYHAERDKRLAANPAGLDQYISIHKASRSMMS
jgi:hypothetical protein